MKSRENREWGLTRRTCRAVSSASYLSRYGILTEEGLIVYSEDGGIIIYVQHCDESDAFSNLDGIL